MGKMLGNDLVFGIIIAVSTLIFMFAVFENAMKKLLALLANSFFGIVILIILNKFGAPLSADIALNLPSVTTAFVLGVPGVAALLIIKLIFKI